MSTNERLNDPIAGWLEQEAPTRLPDRVLEATFERTRGSKQQIDWRARLWRMPVARTMAALGGAAAVVTVAAALTLGSLGDRPAVGGPSPSAGDQSAFLGTWVSTSDADGGTQTMTVGATQDDAVLVVVTDDVASVCEMAPSTMTGTGRLEGGTRLVIATPTYTCDDGGEPQTLNGPPLQDILRDLTYVYDPETDVLTVGAASIWTRAIAAAPSPTPTAAPTDVVPLWPQTSLEEVRQAQAAADAGDRSYAWQISLGRYYQPAQHHPMSTEFFARFLKEELGWEEVLWHEVFAHPDGLEDGDIVFVRCAPAGTNPKYSRGPGSRCAPTIDESRYETVKVNVAQLVRQGGPGIWVVTGWKMIEPSEQIAPPSDADIAAVVEPFIQARIDGEGADDFADVAENDPLADDRVGAEVPLLYATSSGASYVRGEFQLVDDPVWPSARTPLVVTMFGEDKTEVTQRFALERDATDRLRLVFDYQQTGATIEDNKLVPEAFRFLDGAVTYLATQSLGPSQDGYRDRDRLAIVGELPDDDAPRRVLLMLADPRTIGPDCVEGPAPTDAEALARSLQSDPDFEATAPVAVTIGKNPALLLDLTMAPSASACSSSEPGAGAGPVLLKYAPFFAGPYVGDRARLYLLDLPEGAGARVLALVTIADEDSFETVVAAAKPIVDSIEFHAP